VKFLLLLWGIPLQTGIKVPVVSVEFLSLLYFPRKLEYHFQFFRWEFLFLL